MKLNYIRSQSTVKPDLIDTVSSKTTVYLRKNVEKVINEDENDGKNRVYYIYDEAKLTKDEYKEYLNELSILDIQQQRADIDYIALCSGIDLDEV